ncbi:MAG: hypothetical protein WA821_19455 [Anaerolineales bacterium]
MSDNILFICVGAALLGLIPAAIARDKGHSFWKWWSLGAAFFIVALPLAILLKSAYALDVYKRKCPYCAEMIYLEAKVCKHCGRNLPPAFTIPPRYSLEQLPSAEAQVILRRTPEQNLKSARSLIEKKVHHEAIATLQAIVENAPANSDTYQQAYILLFEIFK